MSAKRNLLLGILALQNNFIDRAQLLAAFAAWVEDKSKPLGDLLVQQQALSAEEQALLEALAAKHLERHGQDSDRSLAALSSAGSAHRHLAKIADPDVQASLASLAVGQAALPVQGEDRQGCLSHEDDPFATVSSPPADSTARFVILRPHASGGLGKVSVAMDQELHRQVALKQIKEQHAENAEARSRFLLEAEITGGLEHPGIVPVYSLGTYGDGRPYYAMRFIKGDSLKEAIDRFHKISSTDFTDYADKKATGTHQSAKSAKSADRFAGLVFRKLLGRFVDVCNAIAYAHSRGVLHRDLKPGNIMLGKYGETLVVDWGLAKAGVGSQESGVRPETPATQESLLQPVSSSGGSDTLPGSALGTPSYMSPEQAAGELDQLGPASDVYSLGATLYHLLTGKAPFVGKDTAEILQRVRAGDFAPPRREHPAVPLPLEAVCLKAMALWPGDRYASTRELAEDVERWLADEPVKAWPEPWTVKARRWTNRHRVLVSSAAACLVAALVASVAAAMLLSAANATITKREAETQQAYRELESANEKTKHANEGLEKANAKTNAANENLTKANADEKIARDLAEDRLATSTMQLSRSRFEETNAALAHGLLDQVPPKFRLSPWGLLKNYIAGSLFTLHGHTDNVASVAFAADGQMLASASRDKTVKLWDARTGQEMRTLRGHTDPVKSVAFAPDSQVLASGSVDKTVKLWDARTGQDLRTLRGHRDVVTSVAFARDGQVLASASHDQTVKLWQAQTGKELHTLRGHKGEVFSVAFAPGGQVLASGSSDQTVKLWDARTGQELRTLRGDMTLVWSVAFAADGQVLASASGDTRVMLWEVGTGKELHTLRGHREPVASVAFAADGQVLASASYDNTVKLWDARTGKELRTLRGHPSAVGSVAFAADGQALASASWDKTVKLWDARIGQELRTLGGPKQFVSSVAFAADDQVLASAGLDKTVKLWDARTGKELRTLRGHNDYVTSVAFAAGGHVLASASYDSTVKLWDARTGKELHTLSGHTGNVISVAFAADGQALASASWDKTITLWDARTGRKFRTLRGHTGAITSVAFAADGKVLASASADGTVKLWDAQTAREIHTLSGHTSIVTSVAFAADGQVLASSSNDGTVKLWDAQTTREIHTLSGHTSIVTSVAFAADGQVLASSSNDGTVKLWDARTGQELRTLRGHMGEITSVAFAANGQVLASASFDTIKLWDVRTGLAPERERRFRQWVTAPDLQLHRELAEQADKDKQPFALAFRLGRYLGGKNFYDVEPKEAATLAGWLGTAAQPPGLLPGLPTLAKTPFHEPTFPDGIACTGVLYKDSGIAPPRLVIGTTRALQGDATSWLNHAFHGGALLRSGEHAKALAALTEAIERHAKPHPLTHNLLALTHLQMGETAKAKAAIVHAAPAKDAPFPDAMLHRLFQPEIDAALAKADGKQGPMEK